MLEEATWMMVSHWPGLIYSRPGKTLFMGRLLSPLSLSTPACFMCVRQRERHFKGIPLICLLWMFMNCARSVWSLRFTCSHSFGDCRTSEHFGLAPRRLVESALFRMKNIDTTGYLKSSLGNAVGNAGNAAGLLHPLQPLQHTIDAVEAPQSESMLK